MLDAHLGGLCNGGLVSWFRWWGRRGKGVTNSEYVDVAFDGAFVGCEDVDCERGVVGSDSAGCDGGVRDGSGRGYTEECEGSGEECELHREE